MKPIKGSIKTLLEIEPSKTYLFGHTGHLSRGFKLIKFYADELGWLRGSVTLSQREIRRTGAGFVTSCIAVDVISGERVYIEVNRYDFSEPWSFFEEGRGVFELNDKLISLIIEHTSTICAQGELMMNTASKIRDAVLWSTQDHVLANPSSNLEILLSIHGEKFSVAEVKEVREAISILRGVGR